MRIGLRVINPFQVNQHAFVPGTFIPDEVIAELTTKDPQQLTNRLNNGYVKWEPVPDDTEQEQPADIDALDKAGLTEYAAQVFPGIKLDQRQNVETLRQQVKAMKERLELLGNKAAAQAARSGESARSGGGSSSASSAKPATGKVAKPEAPAAPAQPVAPVPEIPPAVTGDPADAPPAGDLGTGDPKDETGAGGGTPAT